MLKIKLLSSTLVLGLLLSAAPMASAYKADGHGQVACKRAKKKQHTPELACQRGKKHKKQTPQLA